MSLVNRVRSYCTRQRWTLAFCECPLEDIVAGAPMGMHYLVHDYTDRWFADPFILDFDNREVRVLVEEYLDYTGLGRISRLTIDRRKWQLEKIEPVLELDSHLSFPAIRREGDRVYIYPENAQGEGLVMYEYDVAANSCAPVAKISAEPLADAVITDVFGERLMVSTHMPTHNGNVLSIHKFEDGRLVPMAEHVFGSNTARNAGDWFMLNGKVYRPAQDCNGAYGRAVILQEVQRISEKEFVFRDVRRIVSDHPQYTTGLHTLNHFDGLSVVDLHGYRHLRAATTYQAIVHGLKKR